MPAALAIVPPCARLKIDLPAARLSVARMIDRARVRLPWSKLRTQVAKPSPMSELPCPLSVPA